MIPDIFSLKGKTALVTGSSRGIGNAIAMLLGKAGAKVIFHASADNPALAAAVEKAEAEGIAAGRTYGDTGSVADIEKIVKESGDIDILVLNASVQKYQMLPDFSTDEFERSFNTNVRSAYLMIKAFMPHMKEKGWGRVVSIGSVNQWKQSPRLPIYAATKSAQANLIMNCARQYSQFGITFNNIAPGIIMTDRNRETLSDPAQVPGFLTQVPSRTFGKPDDCAGLALLLVSDAGRYITGADIPVSGGMHL